MTNTKAHLRPTMKFSGVTWRLTHPQLLQEAALLEEMGVQDYASLFNRAFGHLPTFLNAADPRGVVEQLNAAYRHGGGWQDFVGFKLGHNGNGLTLNYAGDPPVVEVGRATLREELIVLFISDWVAVIDAAQLHNSDDKLKMRVARMN